MKYTGKYYDVSSYKDVYESIQSVPILKADTAYDNPETVETTIHILNEAICMGEKM